MSNYYVYIIKSLKDGTLYKGFTSDFSKRLEYHNLGMSRYTSSRRPWILIYVEQQDAKLNALRREKSLKRANSNYLKWLLTQQSNLIK